MNLYRRSNSSSFINTQSKDHSDALERAEALLKRIEQRLNERNQSNADYSQKLSNTDANHLHIEKTTHRRKLDS